MPIKQSKWFAAIAAAVIVTVLVGRGTANYYLPQSPAVVAVVNVQEVYDNLVEKLEIEADRRNTLDRINAERVKRSNDVKALQQELELIPVAEESARKDVENDIIRKTAELQAFMYIQERRMNRDTGLRLQSVRDKMLKAIEKTAAANKIDLVLNEESAIQIPQANNQQQTVNVQNVLYAADALEITKDVTTRMNNDFRAGEGGAATNP